MVKELFINQIPFVKRLGKVLTINTSSDTINLQILLRGEEHPIDVSIDYEWEKENEEKFFCVKRLFSSREWINEGAKIWFETQKKLRISVASEIAAILDKVL